MKAMTVAIRSVVVVVALLAATVTFAADSARACCSGNPTLPIENEMTITPATSTIAPVGGTIAFNIIVTDVHNSVPANNDGAANVPYAGFRWGMAGADSILNFTANS